MLPFKADLEQVILTGMFAKAADNAYMQDFTRSLKHDNIPPKIICFNFAACAKKYVLSFKGPFVTAGYFCFEGPVNRTGSPQCFLDSGGGRWVSKCAFFCFECAFKKSGHDNEV